jgi:polysaccharide pyruvyl transferase WcaK-like protein
LNVNGMEAVLINTTFTLGHHGCTLVDRQLDKLASEVGLVITAKLPLQADWEALAPPNFDLILVNGEGALHHDSKAAMRIAQVPSWARGRDRPVCLINSVYQDNSAVIAAGVKTYDAVFVRDEFSRAALAEAGVAASVVPDLTLTWEPKVPRGDGRQIVVTDSTVRTTNVRLHRMARTLGARYLPLKARPLGNVSRRDRFMVKRLAAHFAPPGLWRDRWHDLIPEFDDYVGWMAANAGLVIAGRFHGLCIALDLGIPVVAVASNTWKMEGVLKGAGLEHRLISDIDELQRRLTTEGTEPFRYTAEECDRIAALRREASICARAMLRSILAMRLGC